jgi:tripartite-type tricarboxylate transporter receptor subunit TctC
MRRICLPASEIEKIIQSDAFRSRMEPLGVLLKDLTGEAFAEFQRSELVKWGKAVRDTGTRIE